MITGSTSANSLLGRDGNDTLIGREGSDWLDGGQGVDVLTGDVESQASTATLGPRINDGGTTTAPAGSAYNDNFVFHFGEANGDIVTDFYGAGNKIVGDQLEFFGYGAGTIGQVGTSDYYTITPDDAHGGAAAAETIQLIGVLNLATGDGSNDFLFR